MDKMIKVEIEYKSGRKSIIKMLRSEFYGGRQDQLIKNEGVEYVKELRDK